VKSGSACFTNLHALYHGFFGAIGYLGILRENGVLFGFFRIFSVDSLFCASEILNLESLLEMQMPKRFRAIIKERVTQNDKICRPGNYYYSCPVLLRVVRDYRCPFSGNKGFHCGKKRKCWKKPLRQ
jgi:hypothetical protein